MSSVAATISGLVITSDQIIYSLLFFNSTILTGLVYLVRKWFEQVNHHIVEYNEHVTELRVLKTAHDLLTQSFAEAKVDVTELKEDVHTVKQDIRDLKHSARRLNRLIKQYIDRKTDDSPSKPQ